MKGVLLLSGGIDSPVAGLMMLDRGMDLVLLHMDNRPFTDDRQMLKVRSLADALSKRAGKPLPTFVAPHGKAQARIAKSCDRHVHCILCRRMMLRVAQAIGEREGASCIVTGESLGQVASQTMANIAVEEEATTMPMLRPLIGLDKEEVVVRARALGTFQVSTAPGLCCTIVPEKPSTGARLSRILGEEAKLDVGGLVAELVSGAVRL
ncbi:MAG: hypothetical protein HZB92_07640 [Euryarchaeota archaeon]|nr:hypothetical protein [Euryarchaeota archaeon]